jgi:RNA polymerase sigma-70 factor (ECF subfamily)
MTHDATAGDERARRFRDAPLPYIDDAYTFARFLMRHQADAEDAMQECYLRAQRRFDSFREPAMKPWLLAILRSACYAKLARRDRDETWTDLIDRERAVGEPSLWRRPEAPPASAVPRREDGAVVRRLIAALPLPLREAIVLREFNGLSYREIAEVVSAPVETVVSRLARARAMLLWKATDSCAIAPDNPSPGLCDYASTEVTIISD